MRCYDDRGGGSQVSHSLVATFNHHGDAHGTLRLHLSADRRHITGTFNVTSGTCAGTAGPFHATYLAKLN
jgi:hypothetical protein